MKRSEISAGGVIFRLCGADLQVCLMRDGYGVWTFPKGHVEAGESHEQAALREVREEVGLQEAQIRMRLGCSRYPILSPDGEVIRKTVHWFLMQAAADAAVVPVAAENVQDAGWFAPQDALTMLGYRSLRPLLRRGLKAMTAG